MMEAHGNKPAIRNADTLHDCIITQSTASLEILKEELRIDCSTISLSFDGWTSENHIPIFAVIGHWIGRDWMLNKAVLEFAEIHGIHSGENMALIVYNILLELALREKLLTAVSDSASNNGTLVPHLHRMLLKDFDDEID
jgi:hypothetical protein